MYAVREIMNTQTGERYSKVVISSKFNFSKLESGTYVTGIDDCMNIKVCISDSLFGDKKWYSLPDIDNLIDDIDKGFLGFDLDNESFFSDLMNSIGNGAVLTLKVAYEGYSDEEIKKTLRYKFVGFDIDNFGRVTRIPSSAVKDGVLIIPSELKRLSSLVECVGGNNYNKISISGSNFDIDDSDSFIGLSRLSFSLGDSIKVVRRE